ncbi:hypothetical protein F2Q69_00017045 [Brassica cretica]|uniref:Peptidase C1A papain C-terminal domain-containing protein n=1 Tax=Brassica cretica TaxID=69181 RepID=A0A8S9QZI6_BRACR|nr:hypothetical protein F2Q69_00017045 [Brassica cretica]
MENIFNQDQKNVCWAISLTKHLVALLKLREALDIDAQLSIQYLINKVGDLSMEYKIQGHAWDGSISSFETAVPFLLSGGPLHSERYQATPFRHDMLLVKSDLDEYGIPYWESPNGEGGYIRIRKKVTVFGSICSVLMVSDNVIGRSESMSGDLHGVQPDPIVLYSSHVSVPADDILKSVEFDVLRILHNKLHSLV